jgi:hypothetical protein
VVLIDDQVSVVDVPSTTEDAAAVMVGAPAGINDIAASAWMKP